MLKFFRRIRKQLLNDSQVKKYIIYAIGEILLVVIGILLALQINNWNESRKTKATAHEYLQNIRNDIVADTVFINELVFEGEKWRGRTSSYYHFFDNRSWSLQEVVDSSIQTGHQYNRYFPTNTTFSDMLSAGNTNLLNEKIRRLLTDLKINQDHLVIITDRIITDQKNNLYEVNKYLDTDELESDFFKKIGIPNSDKNLIQGLLHYHEVLELTNNGIRVITNHGLVIKDSSGKIIELIDKELRN